jgi:hypothetical protein
MDLDVRRLSLDAAVRLVDEDARVGQGEPLPRGPGREDHRGRGGGLAQAVRRDVGAQKPHRVVDREQRGGRSARAVHVHRDVAAGLDRVQEEQLRDDGVGDGVLDRLAEEHDALAQQTGVDVERALAARALLDDGRDPRHRSAMHGVLLDDATQPHGCRDRGYRAIEMLATGRLRRMGA